MSAVPVKALLARLLDGATLDERETEQALELLTTGGASPAQMAAFLTALRLRGETVAELTGAARYMRANLSPVTAPAGAIDIVGTGGDGHHTFNVSTCAALVAAAAGATVAKHGNRSVSSLSGASDVLAALGVKIDAPRATLERALVEPGIAFLWAPNHHPAMKAWAPIRAELGVRTIFNLLGPISNPAGVTRQVVGVFAARWVEPIASVLQALGAEHAWVVHGHDGMDELSTTGPSTVAEVKDGLVTVFEVVPEDAGLARAALADLKGGAPAANADALRGVLQGTKGAYRDIVLFNAAAALVVAGKTANLAEGVIRAAHAVDSGTALHVLQKLIAVTNA